MSQDQLAEPLDVSRQAVSKWERNEAMPEAGSSSASAASSACPRITDCWKN
ncbi:MAG: helix-turn-helix transcriptional regulator [Oscillibacter sp.]